MNISVHFSVPNFLHGIMLLLWALPEYLVHFGQKTSGVMTSSTFRMNVNKTQADRSYTENIVCTLDSSYSNEYPEGPLTWGSGTTTSHYTYIYSCVSSFCVCVDLKCLRCHNSRVFCPKWTKFSGSAHNNNIIPCRKFGTLKWTEMFIQEHVH